MDTKFVGVIPGILLHDALIEVSQQAVAENSMLKFTHGQRTVYVAPDSSILMLYRDWLREDIKHNSIQAHSEVLTEEFFNNYMGFEYVKSIKQNPDNNHCTNHQRQMHGMIKNDTAWADNLSIGGGYGYFIVIQKMPVIVEMLKHDLSNGISMLNCKRALMETIKIAYYNYDFVNFNAYSDFLKLWDGFEEIQKLESL